MKPETCLEELDTWHLRVRFLSFFFFGRGGESEKGFVISDHSDHAVSKEPTNPIWTRIRRFLWWGMIRMIWVHKSVLRFSQKNAPLNIICRRKCSQEEEAILFIPQNQLGYGATRPSYGWLKPGFTTHIARHWFICKKSQVQVSHYSVISTHRYLWDPWDTIGTPSAIRLKTHLPEVLKMSTLNCLGSECGANVFCSKLPIKKQNKNKKVV